MNETYMTVAGNVVDEPKLRRTKTGHWVANFRLASTPRRFDRESDVWVDCPTLFVNVTCWRAMGENVHYSVHKGQPVLVTGRYYTRTYEVNETVRIAYELEASAIGHDLSRGTAEFKKAFRPAGAAQIETDADGIPVDHSHLWLDRRTGEIFEPVDEVGGEPETAAGDIRTGPLLVGAGELAELAPAG